MEKMWGIHLRENTMGYNKTMWGFYRQRQEELGGNYWAVRIWWEIIGGNNWAGEKWREDFGGKILGGKILAGNKQSLLRHLIKIQYI